MQNIIIIGSDSFIGSNLVKYCSKKNLNIFCTSRKLNKLKNKTFHFDLKNPNFEFLNKKIDVAIICASITNVEKCQKNPKDSYKINVTNTLKLIKYLNSKSIFTIYLSSNLIFNGKLSFNKYSHKPNPLSVYGIQKARIEKYIKSKKYKNFSVVRLTKVIGNNSNFIKNLKLKIKKKETIEYEENYLFSPVRIEQVCLIIFKLVKYKYEGLFQFGGVKEYNLKEFIKLYFKKKVIIKKLNTEKNHWKNYKNSLKTFLPFKYQVKNHF
mgnify:FL=1